MRSACFVVVMLATVAAAQTPPTEFEVASVKVVPDNARTPVRFTILPDGHVRIASQTLNNVIRQTFGGTAEIVGVPEWARTVILDIDAKTPSGSPTSPAAVFPMLRRLLESRFTMRWHVEQRQMPVYDLLVDKPGELGRGLVKSDVECDGDPSGLIDAELPPASRLALSRCLITFGDRSGKRTWAMKGRTMEQLAQDLRRLGIDRPVRNQTQLQGRYDINVEYPAEDAVLLTGRGGIVKVGLPEQLGLRLEPAIASVPVIVIDSIHRPTEN